MKRWLRKKTMLWILGSIAGLVVIAVLFVASVDQWIERRANNRILEKVSDVPETKVALVLGAAVWRNRRLSDVLEDRVQGAVKLYKAGKVQKLLLSGDNRFDNYDEPSAMRKRALELGVPNDDIVRDFAGLRTLDSIYRARDVWGLQKLVIVSQRFHLPRALFLADKLGIEAVGYVGEEQRYPRSILKGRIREVAARVSAWLDMVILQTKPRFLGRKESLSGDEQVREELDRTAATKQQ
jgi:SanA protein